MNETPSAGEEQRGVPDDLSSYTSPVSIHGGLVCDQSGRCIGYVRSGAFGYDLFDQSGQRVGAYEAGIVRDQFGRVLATDLSLPAAAFMLLA